MPVEIIIIQGFGAGSELENLELALNHVLM